MTLIESIRVLFEIGVAILEFFKKPLGLSYGLSVSESAKYVNMHKINKNNP